MKTTDLSAPQEPAPDSITSRSPGLQVPKLLRPLDIALVFVVASLAFFSFFWVKGEPGQYAEVYCRDNKIAKFDLNSKLREKTVVGAKGTLVLRVGEGRIRVVKAPCRQKICMHMGYISRTSEKIICLPSRLWISISGNDPRDKGPALDGVTF